MAVLQLDKVCRMPGLTRLDEETVVKLLEDYGLGVRIQEEAYEGLVLWMQGDAGECCGVGRCRRVSALG